MPAITALLKVQTGPVQDFIAPARTVRELWAGSWLLSHLARTGALALKETPGTELIYPALAEATDPFEANMPNYFLARVPASGAGDLARSVQDAIRAEWQRIAQAVHVLLSKHAPPGWDAGWAWQTGLFPVVDWIVHPCPDDAGALRLLAKGLPPRPEHAPDFRKAGSSLEGLHLAMAEWKFAARKNSRTFAAWKDVEAQDGALTLIKRFFPEAYLRDQLGWSLFSPDFDTVQPIAAAIDAAEGEVPPGSPEYYAILAMNGDDMATWFSACQSGPGNLHPLRPGYHDALAHRLSAFAARASGIVDQYVGQAIYCGGDGVLALLPAASALPCADELAKAFSRALPGATASIGIALSHVRVPLQDGFRAAHAALAVAKQIPGKDAFCLRIVYRNGSQEELAARWRSGVLRVWRELEERKRTLGHQFAQLLAQRLRRLLASSAEGHAEGWEREWSDALREAAGVELTYSLQREANLSRAEAGVLAESWHGVLTRFSPREYLHFWLTWAFLRRTDDPVEVSNSDDE